MDILSPRAADLAEEIRTLLHHRFDMAARIRRVKGGIGYRIYQVRQPANRHLVDVRSVQSMPPVQRVDDVLVLMPAELIATKVMAYAHRRGKPKAGTDWRDLAMLLLRFPELKEDPAIVAQCLQAAGAGEQVLTAWRDLAAQEILPEDEDDFE